MHLFKQRPLGDDHISGLATPDFQRRLLQGPAKRKREGPRQLPAALCLRLLQMGRVEAARRVASANPAMLIESPDVAARLRETVEPTDLATVGAIFQLVWQQPFAHGERFQRETSLFQMSARTRNAPYHRHLPRTAATYAASNGVIAIASG